MVEGRILAYGRLAWWNKNKYVSYTAWLLLDWYKVQIINKLTNSSQVMAPFMGLKGSCSPSINLVLHDDFFTIFYTTVEGWFPVEFCASLRLLLFYIYFRSLLINTRLVFISYFLSEPLRKSHRGLEYSVRLFVCTCFFLHFWLFVLRLFAFLINCIETFGFLWIVL